MAQPHVAEADDEHPQRRVEHAPILPVVKDVESRASMSAPEVWLRGPVENVPPLLQPVAHALLQCREEIEAHVSPLTGDQLWRAPHGGASVGYHVRHAAGSLD